MNKVLQEIKEQSFFAVTKTSLYQVFALGEDNQPYAVKLGIKGESKIPAGRKMSGRMLAIANCLQFYIPEGHGWFSSKTSFERRLEKVNTQWWLGATSGIVALFFNEDEARKCFAHSDLVPCDSRWLEHTEGMLYLIGEDHPTITICHYPGLTLLEK